MLTSTDLVTALRKIGLGPGDTVHVQSNLNRIGFVEGGTNRQSILDFYLSGLRAVIGETGTISVFTLTSSIGREGKPFIVEDTPAENGVFPEFIRKQPGAVRSCHPIMSVAASGARAEQICGPLHFSGFGAQSPWKRLHEADAKILSLGLGTRPGGTSFLHYCEAAYGVPYQYTKLLRNEVWKTGALINGQFTMAIRYLDFRIAYNTTRFKDQLVETGAARQVPLGGSTMFMIGAADMFDQAMSWLDRDIFGFLEEAPRFRRGEIPDDGATGETLAMHDRGE